MYVILLLYILIEFSLKVLLTITIHIGSCLNCLLTVHKPALIHSKFFPALQGAQSKMSASVDTSAVFVTDNPSQIKNKINKYAFSGGGDTVEIHRERGANIDIDVSIQWLTFFEPDDNKLEHIKQEYKAGRMLTGEVKAHLIQCLTNLLHDYQQARNRVTDDVVKAFMKPRKLHF